MDIKEAQKINLMLLKEFDRFCRKHDIKYRLEAGTLLGAVRHKGFIPWDDDCDVALVRSEYDKLKNALKIDNFENGFVYQGIGDNIDNTHFHDFVDRLFYVNKIYREDDKYKTPFGGMYRYLWLDIFVLDELIPSTRDKNYLKLKIIYGQAMGHRYKIDYSSYHNLIEKIEVLVLTSIGRCRKLKDICDEYIKQPIINAKMKKDNEVIDKYYYSNYPIIWIGWEVERKYEEEYIYVDFEDTKFPINKMYDEVLTNLYGDYMTLPDEKDRIANHVDIF